MPTYDYVCEACGHAFEHFQTMTSRRLRKCPSCGKPKLERLVGSGAGIIFKGSGFYETDYKRAGQKRPAGESKPETPSKSASETGSDGKTASGATDKKSGDNSSGGSGGKD